MTISLATLPSNFDDTFKVVPGNNSTAADSVRPLLRRGVSGHKRAEDVRVISRGLQRCMISSRSLSLNRLWEATVAAFQDSAVPQSLRLLVSPPQVVSKRVKKLGLKEDYQNRDDITDIIRCIVHGSADIPTGVQEIRGTICND